MPQGGPELRRQKAPSWGHFGYAPQAPFSPAISPGGGARAPRCPRILGARIKIARRRAGRPVEHDFGSTGAGRSTVVADDWCYREHRSKISDKVKPTNINNPLMVEWGG